MWLTDYENMVQHFCKEDLKRLRCYSTPLKTNLQHFYTADSYVDL